MYRVFINVVFYLWKRLLFWYFDVRNQVGVGLLFWEDGISCLELFTCGLCWSLFVELWWINLERKFQDTGTMGKMNLSSVFGFSVVCDIVFSVCLFVVAFVNIRVKQLMCFSSCIRFCLLVFWSEDVFISLIWVYEVIHMISCTKRLENTCTLLFLCVCVQTVKLWIGWIL